MKFKIFWVKLWNLIIVFFTGIVYNFHKLVKNVDTKFRIQYLPDGKKCHRAEMYYPEDYKTKKDIPLIFYFHGGGWCKLDKSMYRTLCRRLASFGYIVFNCNYGLAPKNSIDGIIDNCLYAINYCKKIAKDYNGDNSKIVLAGDSAGGNIASLIAGLASKGKLERYETLKTDIKATILFYGVYDFKTVMRSGFPKMDIYLASIFDLSSKNLYNDMAIYSPINYVSASFPPTLIASGKIDKLHSSQSEVLDKVLTQNNVYHKSIFFDKNNNLGRHGFMSVDKLATNKKVLAEIEPFLKEVLK